MYCENCGHKLDSLDKFCTKCGEHIQSVTKAHSTAAISDEKWWYRLLKVAYILLYLPLPIALLIAWSINASTYDYYTNTYQDTSGQALWYCFLTLLVYMAIVRLIKLATLYVAMGKKPEWKKEFVKLF
jgi:polyferredoxin